MAAVELYDGTKREALERPIESGWYWAEFKELENTVVLVRYIAGDDSVSYSIDHMNSIDEFTNFIKMEMPEYLKSAMEDRKNEQIIT